MNELKKNSTVVVILFAIGISTLFSMIGMSRGDAINPDGILYMRTAQAFLDGGIHSAMQIYGWPLYAVLIASITKVLPLSLIHAGQLLNLVLQATIVSGFILLIKELGGSYREQWAAAIVILVFPILNHDRVWFIRDFGYWAFFLIALWQLCRFSLSHQWRHSLGWGCAMALATAFRIEGAIIWLCTPLALLFCSYPYAKDKMNLTIFSDVARFNTSYDMEREEKEDVLSKEAIFQEEAARSKKGSFINHPFIVLLKSYSVIVFIGIVGIVWWGFHPELSIQSSGRLAELLNEFHSGLMLTLTTYQKNTEALATAILNANSYNNASTILVGGLISVLLITVIKTLTPLFMLLSSYAGIKGLMPAPRPHKAILWMCITINVVVIIIFLIQQQFVDGRYIVPLCLLFLCWTPFALTTFYKSWMTRAPSWTGKSWVFPMICFLIFTMVSPAFVKYGNSKVYLVEAGQWINQTLPKDATLYTNSKEVLFYAKRNGTDWDKDFQLYQSPFQKIDDKTWKHFDYLALRFNHDETMLESRIEKELNIPPYITFANKRGDKIVIFEVAH